MRFSSFLNRGTEIDVIDVCWGEQFIFINLSPTPGAPPPPGGKKLYFPSILKIVQIVKTLRHHVENFCMPGVKE